jgi:hypothetical protein
VCSEDVGEEVRELDALDAGGREQIELRGRERVVHVAVGRWTLRV